MKSRKLLSLILVLAICAASLIGCTGNTSNKSNLAVPASGLTVSELENNTAEILAGAFNAPSLFPDAENPFALLLTNPSCSQVSIGLNYDDASSFNLVAAEDTENFKNRLDLSVEIPGMNPLEISLYLDKKALTVKSEELLGEGVYGITFEELSVMIDKIENSALAQMLGITPGMLSSILAELESELGIDEKFFADLIKTSEEFEKYCEKLIENKDFSKDIATSFEPYFSEITEDGDYITVEILVSAEMLSDVSEATVKTFTDTYVEIYEGMIEHFGPYITKLLGADGEEVIDAYREIIAMFNEFPGQAGAAFDGVAADGNAVIYLDKATGLCEKIVIDTVIDEVSFAGEVTLSDGISADITAGDGENSANINFALNAQADDNYAEWSAVFGVTDTQEAYSFKAALELDKTTDAFKLYALADGEEIFSVNGTLVYGKDFLEINAQSITVYGETMPLGFNIELKVNPEISSLGSYKDLFSLTENELVILAYNIGKAVQSISENVMPDFTDTYGYSDYGYDDYYGYGDYYDYSDYMINPYENDFYDPYGDGYIENYGFSFSDVYPDGLPEGFFY